MTEALPFFACLLIAIDVSETKCRCFEQAPASKFIIMRVRPGWCAKGPYVQFVVARVISAESGS